MVYVLNTMIPFNNNIEKKKKTHTHTHDYIDKTHAYIKFYTQPHKKCKKRKKEKIAHIAKKERKKKKTFGLRPL